MRRKTIFPQRSASPAETYTAAYAPAFLVSISQLATSRDGFVSNVTSVMPHSQRSVLQVRRKVESRSTSRRWRSAYESSSTESRHETVAADENNLLAGATIVTLALPLGVYLEEATDGRVFIDELIPEGHAANSGLLKEGDIIVAVSLPFGDSLVPVPKREGLDMIESQIETRGHPMFKLAVTASEGVEVLRRQITEKEERQISFGELRKRSREVHTPEYPIARPDEDGEHEGFDLAALRKYGFDIDDVYE